MMFSSLSKREIKAFAIAVVFVAAVAAWRFIAEPAGRKWVDLDNQINARRVKLRKYIKSISEARSQGARYAKYASFAKGAKSEEQQLALVLSAAEALARRSGVYVNSLKPVAAKGGRLYKKFLVEAEIDGSMDELVNFLYELGRSEEMLKAESLYINAKAGQQGSVRARVLIAKILFTD